MLRSFLFALPLVVIACSGEDSASTPFRAPGGESSAPAADPGTNGTDDAADGSAPIATGDDASAPIDATSPPASKSYAQGKSAGCTKTTGATGLQTRTVKIAGKTRDYLRFIPAGYTPGKPVALVFGFHGSGGTAAKARASFDLESKGGAKAIYIYPQGLPDPAFDGDNRWDPTAGSDDYAFIDALVGEIETSHCVDKDRLFAVGFSNGARFTSMLGCHRGDVFRAIAPIAPGGNGNTLPLAKSACKGEVAIWEGLGTEDPDHLEGATIVRDWYRTANGCAATRTKTTPAGCESYDGCRAKVPSTWCSYPGGHIVPTFAPSAVWTFFAAL